MIIGINKIYPHQGTEYHLQAEDLGEESASYEVRVYDGGTVVWMKRLPYDDLLAEELPRAEHEQALRAKMEKTLLTVEAAIARGKIG